MKTEKDYQIFFNHKVIDGKHIKMTRKEIREYIDALPNGCLWRCHQGFFTKKNGEWKKTGEPI